jgi:hypothetical protein
MAKVKILSWKGIPGQVQARDEGARPVSRALPEWFQQEIDRVAMREGLADSDEYLDLWAWSPEEERPGTAEEVADAVADELLAKWGRKRA